MAEKTNTSSTDSNSLQTISVIVPKNPFIRSKLKDVKLCLAALDVAKLMEWWPGKAHDPNRDPQKVRTIQRSLDWKRVAQIAAYLLQEEIVDAPKKIAEHFDEIYGPTVSEPGREWPPKLPNVAQFRRSTYPTFSNVLVHVNGAELEENAPGPEADVAGRSAKLVFDEKNTKLNFFVIDGQHRINGAYFALCLLRQQRSDAVWEIPAEIFIDLDKADTPPRHQAQIFIDVNFY
jgi:hypothetical protein